MRIMKKLSFKFCLVLIFGLAMSIDATSLENDTVGVVENVGGLVGDILTKTGGTIIETSKNTLDFAGKVINKAFKFASLPTDSKRVKRRADKYMKSYTAPVSKRDAAKINQTNMDELFQSVLSVYGDDLVLLANEFLKKVNSTVLEKRDVENSDKNDKYMDVYVAIKKRAELTEKELAKNEITLKLESAFKTYARELKTLSALFKKEKKKVEKRDSEPEAEPKKNVEKIESPMDKALDINEKFTDKHLKLNDKLSEKYSGTTGAKDSTETAADKYLKLNDKYTDKFMKAYGIAKRAYNEKTVKNELSKEEKKELVEKLGNILEKYSEKLKEMSKEFVDRAKDLGKEYHEKCASVVADFTQDAPEKIQ